MCAPPSRQNTEPVACTLQAIAHVVVVSVAELLVEQADFMERSGAVDRIPGADVSRAAVPERRIALLEIETHEAGRETGAAVGHVAALSGGHERIFERGQKMSQPAVVKDDVLIDLADDWKPCRPDAGVERRRGAGPRPR